MPDNPKYKSTGKIDVDNLYTGVTPADYVRFLYEHDYRLPQHATPIMKATLAQIRNARCRLSRSESTQTQFADDCPASPKRENGHAYQNDDTR